MSSIDAKPNPSPPTSNSTSVDPALPEYSAAPPSYTSSVPGGSTNANLSTVNTSSGSRTAYSTYHVYLHNNYFMPCKGMTIKQNGIPEYTINFKDSTAPLVMHRGEYKTSSEPLATATFGSEFGRSAMTYADGRTVEMTSERNEMARASRIWPMRIQSSSLSIPTSLMWRILSIEGNSTTTGWEIIDGTGRMYAVIHASIYKSVTKLGKLYILVDEGEQFNEICVGALACLWKKAEKDFWKLQWGPKS